MNNIDLLNKDINNFCKEYNFTSELINQNNYVFCFIRGVLNIIDPDKGFIWDKFKLTYVLNLSFYYAPSRKNKITTSYPFNLPQIFLHDHNYMKKIDRHISTDGCCCLSPNVESILILGKSYTLIDFTQKLVIPFFASQIFFDKNNFWPYGEFSHKEEGLIEYYTEKLNIARTYVIPALKVLTKKNNLGRNSKCFCGSSKKFKKCHLELINKLTFNVNKQYFLEDYEILNKYLSIKND